MVRRGKPLCLGIEDEMLRLFAIQQRGYIVLEEILEVEERVGEGPRFVAHLNETTHERDYILLSWHTRCCRERLATWTRRCIVTDVFCLEVQLGSLEQLTCTWMLA